jgi:hypothetical protein
LLLLEENLTSAQSTVILPLIRQSKIKIHPADNKERYPLANEVNYFFFIPATVKRRVEEANQLIRANNNRHNNRIKKKK